MAGGLHTTEFAGDWANACGTNTAPLSISSMARMALILFPFILFSLSCFYITLIDIRKGTLPQPVVVIVVRCAYLFMDLLLGMQVEYLSTFSAS
jgi:hypothetical protein